MNDFSMHTVVSKDGTTISYRQAGSGPGLVICHGSARASQHYLRLAAALAGRYTLYIPDRRGRGLSGPPGEGYGMQKAGEDLVALLEATGARFVFGHSMGGLIALETALHYPLDKIAAYEPPAPLNGSIPTHWLPAFETALAKNKRTSAMVTVLKGLELNEVAKLPRWLLYPLLAFLLNRKKDGEKWEDRFDALMHTLPPEMHMVRALPHDLERYRKLETEVLLLTGTRGPLFFQQALKDMAAVLPKVQTIVYEGFQHVAPEENAERVAVDLGNFFV